MRILIIDDEKSIRNTLKEILEYEGYEVALAENGEQALSVLEQGKVQIDTIFCDIKMPGIDGIEVLEKIQDMELDVPVIMISGHGDIDTAVECIKKGAYDFIEKPLDLNRILITIRNANDRTTLVQENKKLKRKEDKVPPLVGKSPAISRIWNIIERVASTDARVLITGSNGTGKELVARWLHHKSNRSRMPFIEVNCAAIPGELIESELFGHEKGSFTSAIRQHKGKFEQADGGTLFLDEIGDMSLAAQSKVLRVLQENRITRVGSDKDITVSVRVVAATNKDLVQEIGKGTFREDLYHRLSVILIHVPPLAERREDIPLLTEYFIEQICSEYGMSKRSITPQAVEELQKLNWTGNVRELRNVIERLIILSPGTIGEEEVRAYADPLFI
ncbi:MAG TPA: sigma-54 dependent transcriptional regulator [Bacteroidales bacterium]|jgi:DNA-binding NtrC family response regulator|nr:sigma-54-dependent Fis family transcriptional regulator [Bacteroidales bacterium]MCZ2417663.1 sigma-54 dependent transcriptional regulator [Burkholderiales bacterium]OQC57668.1 MAG: Transcriptional regulatory protein ZraR [Bacteroidetes bacterium ADurb.Bin013]MBP8998753.1 sigma-54-dependent Fis family transcriptional regulator [Bacteroidales bacterium]MBV6455338.1 Transcriptional regulatory protein ZraR [Bacteroidales bacterium]